MPLNEVKRKARRILAALRPSERGELMAEQLRDDIAENLREIIKSFNRRVQELKENMLTELESRLAQFPDYSNGLSSLKTEFEGRFRELEKEEIPNIQTQMQDIVSNDIDEKHSQQELEQKLEKRLEELRRELHVRLGNLGGGNANRNILVGGNSSTLSRYTDFDIRAGGGVTLTTATNDDDRTTRVTIAATAATVTASSFMTIAGTQSVLLANVPTTVLHVAVNGQVLSVPADDYNVVGSVLNLLNADTPASVYGNIAYTF